MKYFFISYSHKDKKFATWVAELLEKHNYSVIIQEWDFRPSDNLVSKIHEALTECKKLIIILSKSYLESKWCEAEWTAKYIEQMKSFDQRIIPIRIEPVNLSGLLSSIIYIDIVDKDETDAEKLILSGIQEHPPRRSDGFPAYYNLRHICLDVDYNVQDTSITYIKTCKSKVLAAGKNKIHNRITWYADESIDLYSLTDGVCIERLDLRDTNLNYNVVLDHTPDVGDIVEFRIKAVLGNNHHHFTNFFSSEIIVPIDTLNIHLTLNDESVKKVYTQKLSSSPMNVRTERPIEHQYFTPYHWCIQNPELNFEYKIFW